ncbi:MAG: hypothetical protein P8M30_03655 [Planctomycetaceae bacterium]|jgi:hypothetical protein|nr:hypothetical protein [Planctomycetaceae bacterium]MDB4786742.1 hypothetical protein [Planctomycetaceae bacterium]MDC0308183.1 hypothetical protein [Planctomycetaceae bacterium]MDG2388398.1 hypothetical protein [Planctomycetaceae bacterium]
MNETEQAAAHKWMAVEYFNKTWSYLDQQDRTVEDDEQMLLHALASLFHWTQRPDCTPENRSVGYWQVSRAYSVLNNGAESVCWAQKCLSSAGESVFNLACAHEALARGYRVAGDHANFASHLQQATEFASQIEDADDRKVVESDLDNLRG